jgi:hypothetical protein
MAVHEIPGDVEHRSASKLRIRFTRYRAAPHGQFPPGSESLGGGLGADCSLWSGWSLESDESLESLESDDVLESVESLESDDVLEPDESPESDGALESEEALDESVGA